jgi:peptidoglycan/LPS O-acetylase OafA/YrhL
MEAPEQVRRAIALLWVALLISVVDSVSSLVNFDEEDRWFQLWLVGFVVTVFVVDAVLIFFASKRRNWARVLLLILTVGGLSLYLVFPPDILEQPSEWIGTIAATLLEVVAFVLLFSGTGARWYAKRVAV